MTVYKYPHIEQVIVELAPVPNIAPAIYPSAFQRQYKHPGQSLQKNHAFCKIQLFKDFEDILLSFSVQISEVKVLAGAHKTRPFTFVVNCQNFTPVGTPDKLLFIHPC